MKNGTRSRIVIDTNVLISGMVFGGKPRRLLDLLAERAIIVIISEELLTELRRKIVTKFPDFIEDLERIERLVKRDATVVKLGVLQIPVGRDPDDDKFIETAIIGGADYIVAGDKDLLVIGEYKGTKIISPAEFLKTRGK